MAEGRGQKSKGVDILGRQKWVLQNLPVEPKAWTAAQLRERMTEAGDDLSLRTVERLLKELVGSGMGVATRGGKPASYSRDRHAVDASPAGMPRAQLVTMVLAERYLKDLLPGSLRGDLEGHFANARKQLEGRPAWREARWSTKVALSGLGFRRVPPTLAEGVLEGAYEALFEERACAVEYRAVGQEPKRRVLHPQGMLVRDGVHTLLATIDGKPPKVLEFHLHRAKGLEVLRDRRAIPLDGFDVRRYDPGGGPAIPDGPPSYRAVLLVDARAPVSPAERPFARDQLLEPLADGRVRVTATVPNSRDLVVFLRGYGAHLEVVEPAALRDLFAAEARRLAALYPS